MYIKKNYKNAQTARVTLQRELNKIGCKLSDVEYEIKKVKNSGFRPVVKNGGAIGRMLEKAGIIVTH